MICCKFGKSHSDEKEFDECCFRPWELDVVHVGIVFDSKELEVLVPSSPSAVKFLEGGFCFSVPDAIVDSTIEEIQAVICFGSGKIWKVFGICEWYLVRKSVSNSMSERSNQRERMSATMFQTPRRCCGLRAQ